MQNLTKITLRVAILILGLFTAMVWILISTLEQSQSRALEFAGAQNDNQARFQERLISDRAELDVLAQALDLRVMAQLQRLQDQVSVIGNTPYISFRLGQRPSPADQGWVGLTLPIVQDSQIWIVDRQLNRIAHNGLLERPAMRKGTKLVQGDGATFSLPPIFSIMMNQALKGSPSEEIMSLEGPGQQNTPHFVAAKGIASQSGTINGVAVAILPLTQCQSWLEDWKRLQKDDITATLVWEGQALCTGGLLPPASEPGKLGYERWEDEQTVIQSDTHTIAETGLQGTIGLATSKAISANKPDGSFSDIQYKALMSAAVVLLTTLMLVWLAARRYAVKFSHLVEQTSAISLGDLEASFDNELVPEELSTLIVPIERLRLSIRLLLQRLPPKHPID